MAETRDALEALMQEGRTFPPPESFRKTALDTDASAHKVVVSLTRLVLGFTISIALGAFLGVLMWRWKSLDDFLGPLFLGLQTLPSVCWVPLAILCIGLNEKGVMFVVVMGSFFAIAIALRDGLRAIPPIYQRAGAMLGTSGWRMYRFSPSA